MAANSSGQASTTNEVVVGVLDCKRSKDVWQYFDLCQMSSGSQKARCKKCGGFLGASGNSTLKKHVEKSCPALKAQESSYATMTSDAQLFVYQAEKVREQMCKFVIQEALPFNHFDNPRLTRLIRECLQPQYRAVSRTTLRRDAIGYWQKAQQNIKIEFLNLNARVSLTCDAWSSPGNCYKSYLCVTAHWVDPKTWVMNKRIIAFELFEHPHNATRIFNILSAVIDFYHLSDKLFAISFDNASNNNVAASRLKVKYQPLLDGAFFHNRCACHIINLAVHDGLKIVQTHIDRFKVVMSKVFGKNKQNHERYRKFAKNMGCTPYAPKWDVDVRWNFTCDMLESLTRQRTSLQLFYDSIAKGKNKVQGMQWDLMEALTEMLKVFKQSTTYLSGVYYPTSPLVLNEIFLMARQIRLFEDKDEIFPLITQPMKKKLVKYFKELPPTITCAAALNPCINVSGVESLISKITKALNLDQNNPNHARNAIDSFNNIFRDLFDMYATIYGDITPTQQMCSNFGSSSQNSGGRQAGQTELYNIFIDTQNKKQKTSTPSSELGIYMGSNFLKHMTMEDFQNMDILAWWKEKEAQFPILSTIARDLLSVQASTVASESAFSLSGRILSKLRTNLTPPAVETCVCLKDFLDAEERIQHLSNLEGPLMSYNVESDILEEEIDMGLSTPPEMAYEVEEDSDGDEDNQSQANNDDDVPLGVDDYDY